MPDWLALVVKDRPGHQHGWLVPESPLSTKLEELREAAAAVGRYLAPASEPEVMVYLGMMIQHLAVRDNGEQMYAALFKDYLRLLQFPGWAWAEAYDRVLVENTYFPRINELAAIMKALVAQAERAKQRLDYLLKQAGTQPPKIEAPWPPPRPSIGDLLKVEECLRSIGIRPKPWPEWATEQLAEEFVGKRVGGALR